MYTVNNKYNVTLKGAGDIKTDQQKRLWFSLKQRFLQIDIKTGR